MSLFVLDTDMLTLLQMGHPRVLAHVAKHPPADIAVSVLTVEEQLSGWYTQLRKAKRPEKLAWAYRGLAANVRFLSRVQVLDYDEEAIGRYQELQRLRLKVRKMDLQIAATILGHGGTAVTRNVRDFKVVQGLAVVDWSR
jgi:tRNA(fMet)-specific endonuclease VapC